MFNLRSRYSVNGLDRGRGLCNMMTTSISVGCLGRQDRSPGNRHGAERHQQRRLDGFLLRVPTRTSMPRRVECPGSSSRKAEGELKTRCRCGKSAVRPVSPFAAWLHRKIHAAIFSFCASFMCLPADVVRSDLLLGLHGSIRVKRTKREWPGWDTGPLV